MIVYYIGMGSNMGDREGYLEKALRLLALEESIQIKAISSFYETAPWGNTNQDAFINAVCAIETTLLPEELLQITQRIEYDCDRERHEHWGPRTLDLDILSAFNPNSIQIDEKKLTIPHPYFWDRNFVLEPLAEIAPEYTFNGQTIQARILELKQLDA